MSSSSSSSSTQAAATPSPDTSFEKGLVLAAGVIGFLILLVLLRLFCNLFIDVAILGEVDALQQWWSETWRRLCPWWRPRTSPEATEQQQQQQHQQQSPSTSNEVQDSMQCDIYAASADMSTAEWNTMINSLLPSKKVTADDLAMWKEGKDGSCCCSSSSSVLSDEENQNSTDSCAVVCSICLHTIDVGHWAVSPKACQHVFHSDCISQWLTRNVACPYCRTDMISRECLHEATRPWHAPSSL